MAPRAIKNEATSPNLFKFRYPFVACDVLTTENNSPAEFILPEKDLYVEEDELEEVEVEEEVEEP